MKKIHSFEINHDEHGVGFYLSTIQGDIYTYDLRFVTPNGGEYLPNPTMHTIEHLFATVSRNGALKDKVIYFGPMGCRTGFYFLLRDIDYEKALAYTTSVVEKCLTIQDIPGNSRIECGNYLEHDFADSKAKLSKYLKVLQKIAESSQKE